MPLTTEQIDAAKAELVYDSPRKIRVLGRDYMRQNDGAWNEYVRPSEDVRRGWGWLPIKDATLAPSFDRALARAHLAEARRLGVPAWTLEELEAESKAFLATLGTEVEERFGISEKMLNSIGADNLLNHLHHLKSLPNA